MASALEQYRKASEAVQIARAAAREVGKAAFAEASQALFSEHPEIQKFGWTQYTPYFNDGEPCEFGVNEITINGISDYGYNEDDEKVQAPDKSLYEAAAAMRDSFAEDDLKEMLGDHVKVTVTREGVDVDEYDHD